MLDLDVGFLEGHADDGLFEIFFIQFLQVGSKFLGSKTNGLDPTYQDQGNVAIGVDALLLIEFRIEGEIDVNNVLNLKLVRFGGIDLCFDVIDDFQLVPGIEPIVAADHP